VASILAEGGMDPTFVIGGRLNAAGANARLGSGDFLVAEADESDASFLFLSPVLSIVTNIDADHMETYGHDFSRLKQAFVDFVQRLPFYGVAVLCADDANVREIMPLVSKQIVTYGSRSGGQRLCRERAPRSMARCVSIAFASTAVSADWPSPSTCRDGTMSSMRWQRLRWPANSALPTRRSSRRWPSSGCRSPFPALRRGAAPNGGRVTLVDDYGHHPVEMRATLAAARGAFPGRRLLLAFQPHRYTRTRDCFDDFVKVLSGVDALVLAEVYAAGEQPIVAADGRALARACALPARSSRSSSRRSATCRKRFWMPLAMAMW
jgi:UDP-N-acetylmuramate--alanine ligase